ncbi:ABC transporter ATP-binding protein [Faecalispora jeddahensis]|uniref:ABC transporter ATP-binding protein n=1 Tax=Faecalispora jeddahensis TaxID=1414721 RepID=UPI0027B9F94E|nr:dipeptide ABC transporter ATP-binding protein [Faecalispora jeddahensis]
MNEVLLDVKNVSKTFPVKAGLFSSAKGVVHAVDNVSFQIHRGESFGLVGESGCGKSTLSRTLLQLVPADSGEICFNGNNLAVLSKKEMRAQRESMRMVFQKPFDSLNPRQTVRQIISAPMQVHRKMSRQEMDAEVMKLMDLVGLSRGYVDRYPHEFSGGQRQRIGIARALALQPQLIVCDEPVSALDVSIQAQILNLLKDLQKEFGLTYLFISHNLAVVKHMSDRIAVMYLGSLVEVANGPELYRAARHPYTQALLSAIPDPGSGQKRQRIILTGDIPSPVNPPAGCRFCTRCPNVMERCKTERPALRTLADGGQVACFLYEQEGGTA